MQMEMDGGEGKSQFGGSNKRARTAAGSEWDSQVFSDDDAEADVRTKLGAATLSGDTRKARTAGVARPPTPIPPSPPLQHGRLQHAPHHHMLHVLWVVRRAASGCAMLGMYCHIHHKTGHLPCYC